MTGWIMRDKLFLSCALPVMMITKRKIVWRLSADVQIRRHEFTGRTLGLKVLLVRENSESGHWPHVQLTKSLGSSSRCEEVVPVLRSHHHPSFLAAGGKPCRRDTCDVAYERP